MSADLFYSAPTGTWLVDRYYGRTIRVFCIFGTWNPNFCKAGTFLQSWNLFALRVHSQHASMPTCSEKSGTCPPGTCASAKCAE